MQCNEVWIADIVLIEYIKYAAGWSRRKEYTIYSVFAELEKLKTNPN